MTMFARKHYKVLQGLRKKPGSAFNVILWILLVLLLLTVLKPNELSLFPTGVSSSRDLKVSSNCSGPILATDRMDPDQRSVLVPGIVAYGQPETVVLFLALTIAAALLCRIVLGTVVPWLPIPMTVPLMVAGLAFGYLATKFPKADIAPYLKACGLSSRSMMYLLLPGLTFDLCFKVPLHIFRQCSFQIFSLSTIGLFLEMTLTVAFLQFTAPIQPLVPNDLFMFGTVSALCLCASDSLAVVEVVNKAISYRDEGLPVILDGETMVNNAIAVASYQIIRSWVLTSNFPSAISLALFWFWAALCGIAWGRIISNFLARVPQDPIVEILTTVFATYALYYVVDEFVTSAGVLSVMFFGLILNWDLEETAPEISAARELWWSVFAFVANACVFVINACGMGQTIADPGADIWSYSHMGYPIILYGLLLFIRMIVMLVLMLPLNQIGYCMSWKDGVVIVLGWLKGDMALTIAYMSVQDADLKQRLGNYNIQLAYFWTVVVAWLTQFFNGFVMKFVLSFLKYDLKTQFQIEAMNLGVSELNEARDQAIIGVKSDRSLYRSDWGLVEKWTALQNPYLEVQKPSLLDKMKQKLSKREPVGSQSNQPARSTTEQKSDKDQEALPSLEAQTVSLHKTKNTRRQEDHAIFGEEYMLRYLKAITMNTWKLQQSGLVSMKAAKIINMKASNAISEGGPLLTFEDFKDVYTFGFFLSTTIPLLRRIIIWTHKDVAISPKKQTGCKYWAHVIRYSNIVRFLRVAVPSLHCVAGISDFLYTWRTGDCFLMPISFYFIFLWAIFCLCFYVLHMVLVMILGRVQTPFELFSTTVHVLLVMGSVGECCISAAVHWSSLGTGLPQASDICHWQGRTALITKLDLVTKSIRIAQLIGLVDSLSFIQFFKLATRTSCRVLLRIMNEVFSSRMSLAYDIGRGILMAEEGVSKIMGDIVEDPLIAEQFLHHCITVQNQWQKKLVQLRRENPGVTRAVKTKHAMMTVLKSMASKLHDLQEEGILFEKEFVALETEINAKLRRVINKMPSYLEDVQDETIFDGLSWLHLVSKSNVTDFVKEKGIIKTFEPEQPVAFAGDPATDIWLIVNGVVKVRGLVRHEKRMTDGGGHFPNTESFTSTVMAPEKSLTSDFLGEGCVIGKIGILTRQKRVTDVVCDTEVEAYNLKIQDIEHEVDYAILWHTVAMEVGAALIESHPDFRDMLHASRWQMLSEGQVFGLKSGSRSTSLYPWMELVIVLQGQQRSYGVQGFIQTPRIVDLANEPVLAFAVGHTRGADPVLFVVGKCPVPVAELGGAYTLIKIQDHPKWKSDFDDDNPAENEDNKKVPATML